MAARKKRANRGPQNRDALWRVAVHEAGHAVVAHALGLRVGDMTIVPGVTAHGDDYAGFTALAHDPNELLRAIDEYYDLENDNDDREEKTFFFFMKNMQVSFAGMLAEALFFGAAHEDGCRPDREAISMYADRLCPPDAQEIDERSRPVSPDITTDEAQGVVAGLIKTMPKQEYEHFTDWVEHRTRKLLRMRRDLVEALALKLHDHETLTAAEAVKTILDAMRKRRRAKATERRAGASGSTEGQADKRALQKQEETPQTCPHALGSHELQRALARHRDAARDELTAKTESMVRNGVRLGEIIWLLTPDGCDARVATDFIAQLEGEGDLDVANLLSVVQECLPPGHLPCAYSGPEGRLVDSVCVDLL